MEILANGLILICLIAGQAEILVAIVNRSHSFPVRSHLLRHFRHVHDALLVLFPIALIGWVGLYDPGVLRGGSWNQLCWPWTIVCLICAGGFASLVRCAIRWQMRRPPTCRTNIESCITNIAERHEKDIMGSGPYPILARLPGNQILQLDNTEKTYPAAIVGQELTILHLTDFHWTGIPGAEFYRSVIDVALEREYDLVCFTGDLIDDISLLEWFPETLGRLNARLGCFYILGNHDWVMGDSAVREMFDSYGWTNIAGQVVSIPGTDLVVGGTETPWMGANPDFSATAANAKRILLSHGPDNLEWAKTNNVAVMLSGHNHGGQVVLPIIGPVYSPSWHGVKHSSGDFFDEPTLLHVCRGIGARHPLRLNCRPEIATLVFSGE